MSKENGNPGGGKINAKPLESVHNLGIYERALGDFVSIDFENESPLLNGQISRDLAGDCFWSYFSDKDILPDDEIKPGRAINKMVLQWAKETPGFEASKIGTRANLLTSAVSAGLLHTHLCDEETIKEALKQAEEAEQKQQEAEQKQAEANAMQQAAEALGGAGDEQTPEQAAEAEAMQQQAQEAQQEAQQAQQEAEAISQQAQESVKDFTESAYGEAAVSNAIDEAQAGAEKKEAMLKGWGMEDSEVTPANLNEILGQLEKIEDSQWLPEIADLMGRLKGIALETREENRALKLQVVNAGVTQNLTDVFTGERALLSPMINQAVRAQQTARFADSGLLGLERASAADKAGNMVIAIDESGSMRGQEYIRASALGLGLAQAAREAEAREYIIFKFSTRGNMKKKYNRVHSSESWASHLGVFSGFHGGGTDFNHAINKAIEEVISMDEPEKTDIVFITDAEAGIDESTRARMKRLKETYGVRFIGLDISPSGSYYSYDDLKNMSDGYLRVGNLNDIEKIAGDISNIIWQETGAEDS